MQVIGLAAHYFWDEVRDEPAVRIVAKTTEHDGVYVVLPFAGLILDPREAMTRLACDLQNCFDTMQFMIDQPKEAQAEMGGALRPEEEL